jgi:hypothetical protein
MAAEDPAHGPDLTEDEVVTTPLGNAHPLLINTPRPGNI